MSRRYLTGTRSEVLQRMAEHAIRDQIALFDAHRAEHGELGESHKAVRDECGRNVADYMRIASAAKRGAA